MLDPLMTDEMRARIKGRYHIEELTKPEGLIPTGYQILDMDTEMIIAHGLPSAEMATGYALCSLIHEDYARASRELTFEFSHGRMHIQWGTGEEDEAPLLVLTAKRSYPSPGKRQVIDPACIPAEALDQLVRALKGETEFLYENPRSGMGVTVAPGAPGECFTSLRLKKDGERFEAIFLQKDDAEDIIDLIECGRKQFRV